MRPSVLSNPPPIDPRDHAVESRSWDDGQVFFHLVSHDGRYYAWIAWPGHHLVYPMPGAAAARSFLAGEQAFRVLTVPPGECAAHVLVLDPAGSSHIIYRAAVVDGGTEGIWLATGDGTGAEESRALAGFADLAAAVEAFAHQLTDAAGRIERDGATDYPRGWPDGASIYRQDTVDSDSLLIRSFRASPYLRGFFFYEPIVFLALTLTINSPNDKSSAARVIDNYSFGTLVTFY